MAKKLSDFMIGLLAGDMGSLAGTASTLSETTALTAVQIKEAMDKLSIGFESLDHQHLKEKAARAPEKTVIASTPASAEPGIWDKFVVEKSRQSGLTSAARDWPGAAKRSDWVKDWMTAPAEGPAVAAAQRAERELRLQQRNLTTQARVKTVHHVAKHHRNLLGVRLQRFSDWQMSDLGEVGSREGLEEILHKANFRRERYGYHNHRGYQDHLEGLVNQWSDALHAELITHIEADDVEKQRAAKRHVEEELRAATERLRQEEEKARLKALAASDPVDALPDELEAMLELEAERSVGRAEGGIW